MDAANSSMRAAGLSWTYTRAGSRRQFRNSRRHEHPSRCFYLMGSVRLHVDLPAEPLPVGGRTGIVIIDDYGTWDGCTRAVHAYLAEHNRPGGHPIRKGWGGLPQEDPCRAFVTKTAAQLLSLWIRPPIPVAQCLLEQHGCRESRKTASPAVATLSLVRIRGNDRENGRPPQPVGFRFQQPRVNDERGRGCRDTA